MCNYCDPKGWNKKCCGICGVGSDAYISISIAVPHGEDFPYSTTDLCEKCWKEHGISAALQHNEQCRADLMPNVELRGDEAGRPKASPRTQG